MALTSDIEGVLDRVRPAMEADGGGVELISVEGGLVRIRLNGTCLTCPSASLTMKLGIERTLRDSIPWITEIVRVP